MVEKHQASISLIIFSKLDKLSFLSKRRFEISEILIHYSHAYKMCFMNTIKVEMLFALLLCKMLKGFIKFQKYTWQYAVVHININHHVARSGREKS